MSKLNLENISEVMFANIDMKDYPDFVDAFVSSAKYTENGVVRYLTDDELVTLTFEHKDWCYPRLLEYLN